MRETSLSLPLSVRQLLRDAVGADRTVAQVILDAIENNAEDLASLIAAEAEPPAGSGGLFPDRPGPKIATEPRSTAPLLTTEANLAVIDGLVAKTGARSRSQLVSVALRAELARP